MSAARRQSVSGEKSKGVRVQGLKGIGGLLLTGSCVLLVSACGSSGSSGSSSAAPSASGLKSPTTEKLTCASRGGTLEVLQEGEFERLDPGIAYGVPEYGVVFATQRPLYSNKPNTSFEVTPDTAEGSPVISDGGREVTVKIRHGIHFSPPVNTEVTSEDVAYAIERGANPNVANPYFQAYFQSIEGAPDASGGPIAGIVTPSRYTIEFKLRRPVAQLVADALVLPLTAPVPKQYAEPLDRHAPSEYEDHQVATGPYMLENNAQGDVQGVGYVRGKSVTLVRNPNWSASTDFRPACLSKIAITIGGDGTILAEETLKGTDTLDSSGGELPPGALTEAYSRYKSQLEISSGGGEHFIGVNNAVGPFANEDLRKAFYAALNRVGMNRLSGGTLVTYNATHFIYPTIPGFEQAGGLKGPTGPKYAFDEHPEGDMTLAERYIKEAGYPSGKYTGGKLVTIVGATGSPNRERAELVNQTLKSLGFPTKLSIIEKAAMYSKYCGVPKEETTVCPNVEWAADFGDPQTVLDITFNGRYITPEGSVNWSQTNIPLLNSEMDHAEEVQGQSARDVAWAKIDDQLVERAAAIPVDWDKPAWIEGSGVEGVGQLWNSGQWDYSYTSLK
jgi:peptide/nickel transport system substrate-binding protein